MGAHCNVIFVFSFDLMYEWKKCAKKIRKLTTELKEISFEVELKLLKPTKTSLSLPERSHKISQAQQSESWKVSTTNCALVLPIS